VRYSHLDREQVMSSDPTVIVGAMRTPMGGFQGALASRTAAQLGSMAIQAALEHAKLSGEDVDEVLMGNVLSAGQGQAPARQAALGAGLPLSAGCSTINKMCGSGLKTVMLADDLLQIGRNRIMVAGGMESMSNAPYLLDKARQGLRLGHGAVKDHMFLDGLEDAYDKGRLMGTFAEDTAEHYQFTREEQDRFALTSLSRARAAQPYPCIRMNNPAQPISTRSPNSAPPFEIMALSRRQIPLPSPTELPPAS
jgi:acetyl-CoA C-acetyltransferase